MQSRWSDIRPSFYLGSRIMLMVIISLIFYNNGIYSQGSGDRPSMQSAIKVFNNGQYEQAYKQFLELLSIYPKDPLYKYYCGVCLVKLEKEPEKALNLLKEAAETSAAIKPVPSDVWFWLGRAQQLCGMFDEAVLSYNKFTELAGKKTAKEMNVPYFIKQSMGKEGKIVTGLNEASLSESVVQTVKNEKSVLKSPSNGDSELNNDIFDADEKEYAPVDVDSMLSELLIEKKTDKANNIKSETKKDYAIILAAPKEPVKKDESKVPVFSQFEIIEKPDSRANYNIPINPAIPKGLVYRVQVGIFRNPVSPSFFKGLYPVEGFRNEGSDLTTYYAGIFRKASDASTALLKIKSMGFKDAFIVALMDGKQVSMDKAAILEKEWGSKPLFEISQEEIVERDTIPPTLVFRVEIARSQKPLPKERIEEIKKLAAGKQFDILVNEKKENIYLMGIFLSFKSASEYADLLVRNGYRDAKVVAYLGDREIPVELARKLFEEY
ncbi:MAG TPA: hypothetical protein PLN06_02775 [Bacteroidales bacterium]|nr:hypothetical protein [Bacteroidales bacterium]HOU95532.1 hypothetical protein [Bacteroidales bacterium]HQG36153.1 hypothetical protein [Bacteroidales bacterium]HQG53397.1 hypothetical protein [Bacteroidales bacterium]HQJ20309.1 hypothetical protein [Bacteroidales bacterium]